MELKTFFAQDAQGNTLPTPTAYLYLPGTTTLASGLQDASGSPLSNPFTGDANGRIQLAAPDGDYDLRVVKAKRDYTMRVRFIDVAEQLAEAQGIVDDLKTVWYGDLPADPEVDPLGNPPKAGASYYNTTLKQTRIFDGAEWGAQIDPTDASAVAFQQAGSDAVARTAQDKLREFVSVKDFGAVGDGVTNDSASIAAAIAAGRNIYFPAGNYRISTLLQITKQNARLYGDGNASRIFSDTLVAPVKLVSITNLVFEDLFFETTATGASVFGVVYSDGATLSNVTFSRCKFSAQLANTNGFKAVNEGANIADRVAFIGCEFLNIGRMGIEFQNHNDGDVLYRFKRVTIDRCYFKNIGLLETFGIGVSLSGYGEQCYVTNNSFDNCWSCGIEGVGVKDSVFDGNTFSGFSTRSYLPFSFSGSRPMPGLSIRNNKVDGAAAGRWNLYNMSNGTVSGNLLRSGHFFLRDTCDCVFKDNFIYQSAADPHSVLLEGNSKRNKFISCVFDATLGAQANQSTVAFSGSGVADNVVEDCRITKSSVAAAISVGTSVNNKVIGCVIDGILYEQYLPFPVRKGLLSITSVSGVSKLVIAGIAGASWATRMIRFTVHGIGTDSTGRVAASRQIEVRGQGTNTPTVGGTATIFESGCTISYENTSQTLVIVCTNTGAENAVHRWEYEIVGAPVGEVSVAT